MITGKNYIGNNLSGTGNKIHKTFNSKSINKSKCNHIFLGEYSKKDLDLHYNYPRLETKINQSDIDYYKNRIKFIKQNYNFFVDAHSIVLIC